MRRIVVLGNTCSGKSTVTQTLAERLGIPAHHLDAIYWQPGWVAGDASGFRAAVETIVAGERWIIDGNYARTLDVRLVAADTVVFLDYPVRTCLRQLLWGRARTSRPARIGAPAGCDDGLNLELAWQVLSFPWRKRRRLLERLAACAHRLRVVRLRNGREMHQFLTSLPSSEVVDRHPPDTLSPPRAEDGAAARRSYG